MSDPLPQRDSSTARPSRAALARLVLLAGISFVAVGLLVGHGLRPRLPALAIGSLDGKIANYQAYHREIDTIVIGTSRVHHQIDPRAVDRGAAAHGCDKRTLNLGLGGANHAGLRFLLKMIRDDPPPNLTRVVLEPRASPSRELERLMAARFRRVLDADSFIPGLVEIRANPRGGDSWAFQTAFASVFAYHHLGIGTVSEQVLNPPPEDLRERIDWLEDRRGYRPMSMNAWGVPEVDPEYYQPETIALFREQLAGYRESVRSARLRAQWSDVLESLFAIAEEIPAPLALLFPPDRGTVSAGLVALVERDHPNLPILGFDPVSHPGLYDVDYWWNRGHLNDAGSAQFSERVGAALCALEGAS